jgi:ectoine hydroxylase-related dioxygenase (phytanoyl-CoA dioxygenase family)
VRLYWDQAVYKKPEKPRRFPWHQDNGYTFVDPQAYVTCWVALSDATVKNGCLWALPGEHKRGTFSHRVTRVGLVCLYDDPPTRVALPMRAGSIAVMSSLTPHATGANLSDATRKGLVAEFMPDGAGTIRKTETGELVRTPLVGPHNMWVLKDGKAPAA